METPVKVRIEFTVEWGPSSPADTLSDLWPHVAPEVFEWESVWMSETGLTAGNFIGGAPTQYLLYPPFTDAARRQLFAIYPMAVDLSAADAVEWHLDIDTPVYGMWITTDDDWQSGSNGAFVGVTTTVNGSWFAVEGEDEDDFRVLRRGSSETVTL